MAAKSNGLEDECQSILEASGLTEDQISMPSLGRPLSPPRAIVPTFQANWPTKATSHNVFEQALLGDGESQDQAAPQSNGFMDEEPAEVAEVQQNGFEGEEEEEDAGGWDMGEEEQVEQEIDFVHVEGPAAGAGGSEADMWSRMSPIAADHVAGGSFDTAMQLLNRQIGAVNFEPLWERFEEIYQASRTFLPANAGLSPLVNYVRRTVDETDAARVQPIIPRDIESITATEFASGKRLLRENKLEEGVASFRKVLHLLMVNAVTSQQQATEACYEIHSFQSPLTGSRLSKLSLLLRNTFLP
jgi:coatomer protein complex subunit alpha (xenin)